MNKFLGPNSQYASFRLRQSGVAFLLLIVVLVLTTTTLLMTRVSRNQQVLLRSNASVDGMSLVRDALLGYALSQTIPGVLPCPDSDGDGDADATVGGCDAVVAWLPYRTLGLDDLRDASGAKLWYAVDPNYTLSATPFNSSSISNLNVNGEAAAFVILAPNAALDGQTRPAGNTNRANYFEGVNGDSDPYRYQYQPSDNNNNDQLLANSLAGFWALIENSRVVPEAMTALNNYFANCNAYPWAATFNSGANLDSVASLQQGNLPLDTSVASNGTVCADSLSVPTWLRVNWGAQLQYAFCLNTQGQCLSLSGDITASTVALVIGPGSVLSGQSRPSPLLSQYFETINQVMSTDFLYRLPKNHDGSFNDVLLYLP